MNSLSQQYETYIQELELNPELVLNKHFRFPNEANKQGTISLANT